MAHHDNAHGIVRSENRASMAQASVSSAIEVHRHYLALTHRIIKASFKKGYIVVMIRF